MADFVLRVQPQQSPEKPELNDQYNQALGHLGYADLAQHTSSDRTAADSRIGLALLEETADAGFAPAQFVLAQLCDGRRRDVPRNDEMQFRWAEASAAQNMPEAQLLLSNLYVRGRGCSPNRIRSLQWLRTAADAKYLPALVRVGLYYLEDGAYPEAEQFFRQALELRGDDGLRDADALYYLGHMVCEGAGRGGKRARKAPLSAGFHSFRLIFGRAIISRNGVDAWFGNTHVEATSNHPFPAQARAASPRTRPRAACSSARPRSGATTRPPRTSSPPRRRGRAASSAARRARPRRRRTGSARRST